MTRLCADAMGYEPYDDSNELFLNGIPPDGLCVIDKHGAPAFCVFYYNPLRSNDQAMKLVKKFQLSVGYCNGWAARMDNTGGLLSGAFHYPDLNRAIVECVSQRRSAHADGIKNRLTV